VRIAHDGRARASETGVRLLNAPIALGCEAIAETPWAAPAKVDDRTMDYLLLVRYGFALLGHAARGLAALLSSKRAALARRATTPPFAAPAAT
jgi:hypothetical protein